MLYIADIGHGFHPLNYIHYSSSLSAFIKPTINDAIKHIQNVTTNVYPTRFINSVTPWAAYTRC